ncbi:hypothetical protein DBR17_02865 [Sphingomonas sp. HMWF008]|nr:hypothetical protein DBR17_02865 [Sphingomonas sp. HMWF008]
MGFSTKQRIALGVSAVALGWSIFQSFLPIAHTGITAVTMMISAILWLAGSVYAEFPRARPLAMGNLFNAMAASFAAVAGMTTIDHGAKQVGRFMTGRPPAHYDAGNPTPTPSGTPYTRLTP